MNIDKLAKEIYEQNKAVGWWDDPNRCIYTCLQLISTEVAEATEAERKNLMDDHLPDRKGGEVELADALIRVLDLGGRFGWRYDTNPRRVLHPRAEIGHKHLLINMSVVSLSNSIEYGSTDHSMPLHYYSELVNIIIDVAESQGYDIAGAMLEKLEYNKKRLDHKRENRAKEGGKAF